MAAFCTPTSSCESFFKKKHFHKNPCKSTLGAFYQKPRNIHPLTLQYLPLKRVQKANMCYNWMVAYICPCKAPYCGRRDNRRRSKKRDGHVMQRSTLQGQWLYCDRWFMTDTGDKRLNAFAYPKECPDLRVEDIDSKIDYCDYCKENCCPESYDNMI